MTQSQLQPILSADEWRRLESISSKGVDELIKGCAIAGNGESIKNAMLAGCAHRGSVGDRMKYLTDAFAEVGPPLAEAVREWVTSFANGEGNGEGHPGFTADVRRDLLTKVMNRQVENCEEGSFDLIRMLVDLGIDPQLERDTQQTTVIKSPMVRAIEAGNVRALHLFLGEGRIYDEASPLPSYDRGQGQLLMRATDVVLEKGLDYRPCFDAIVSHMAPGYTKPFEELFERALRFAAGFHESTDSTNGLSKIATLISLGAQPGLDRNWQELLETRVVTTILFSTGAKYESFPQALIRKAPDEAAASALDKLLSQGILDPNQRNESGATLLHLAAEHSKHRVIESLIIHGADATATAPKLDFLHPDRMMRPVDVIQQHYGKPAQGVSESDLRETEQKLNAAAAKQAIEKTLVQVKARPGATL